MHPSNQKTNSKGILLALLAAALYAVNAPFSKLLLSIIPPTLMAGFLYLGAGIGMFVLLFFRKMSKHAGQEARLTSRELPDTIAMILLDIAAPIFLMTGIRSTSAANASLLNNFEIAATALIALLLFKEVIPIKLWIGIGFITVSCILLSYEDLSSLQFSGGSLLILAACVCWGFENNCTRKLSSKDPLQIVLLKGIFSGTGSLIIGILAGEKIADPIWIPAVLLLGLIAYGLSIFFYVYAQRYIGAAKTSAYYAVSPFIGTILSLLIFSGTPSPVYFLALACMAAGAWLAK